MFKLILKVFLSILLLQTYLSARDINLDKLSNLALKSNKTLFVFLHRTDCGYCESMLQFTLDDDYVTPFVEKKFLYEHINISEKDVVTYKDFKGTGREFAKSIGYDFYPTSVFFDEQADISYAIPGYQEEKKFYKVLNYIDSKAYKNSSFRAYSKSFKQEPQ